MMKKVLGLIVIGFFLVGCAQTSWQTKSTTTYMAGAIGIKAVDHSFKTPCIAATLPKDKCLQINGIGGKTVLSYIASGDVLMLALTTTDAVKKEQLLAQWPVLWENFTRLTNEIIDLVQQLSAQRTGTAMPELKKSINVSPEVIGWIISALGALVQAIPDIWAAIQSGQVDETDIQILVVKIQTAQDSVRGLFGWQIP